MDATNFRKRPVVFYLVPEFTMLAFTSAIEALRLANNILGFDAYSWRLASENGGSVRASCGLSLETDSSVAIERAQLSGMLKPSAAFVCAGKNVQDYHSRTAGAWLRECRHRGVMLGSFCTGTYLLAQAGLLDGRRCTIHWENFPGFAERFPTLCVTNGIYEIDGSFLTCAGGTASFDMMLHLIGEDFGEAIVNRICEQALMERVRGPADRQRLPLPARLGVNNPIILKVVERMEATLTEPQALPELAASVGLSRRQIERLFHRELGRSPARYYLELRLERAHLLLTQSSLPIIEVAIACGFAAGSHFSKCYREAYGYSPQQTRATRHSPLQKRERPVVQIMASPDVAELADQAA
ncbi:MAG: GlxA family transcriptional regulator [Shinella sp.]|nr:GlxA family transcriptional regulator [Shinella sp.]